MATDTKRPAVDLEPRKRKIAAQIAEIICGVDPELNEIAADLTRLYRETIPVYGKVDPDSIKQNTRAVLRIVVRQLGSEASQSTFDELSTLARTWANQQIPLALVAHSIQIGARSLFDVVRQRASAQALPVSVIDEMQDLTWEWATVLASAVHMVLQEQGTAGTARRADFLRRLIDGSLSPAALDAEAKMHRLDPAHGYRIACAAWDETVATSDLMAGLRVLGSTLTLPVVDTVIDRHVVALLPRTPERLANRGPVALGTIVSLSNVASSFRYARQALEIAIRYGKTGLVDLAALGPLPLLECRDDVATMLAEKHLAPLGRLDGAGAEIVTTVEVFLDCDRRVDDAAAKLYVHRNTVRNRLRRFGELTGLDLDRTEDLIVAWWLLNRERLPCTDFPEVD